ncbi:MAG TPA: tryptophan synthase subunit alpha, partial [Chitinophagaceae bacterium]
GLDFIFLVTPETEDERVMKLDELSSGFLYAVSSSSITGTNQNFDGVKSYLFRLKALHLKNPVMVGFGIRDKESFDLVCEYANGGIIGSAYIQSIDSSINIELDTMKFIRAILKGAANGT